MRLFIFSYLIFLFDLTTTIILDIFEPSIITWHKNNTIAALVLTSINIENNVILTQINQLPFNIVLDKTANRINNYSFINAQIYQSLGVFYDGSVNYYYKSFNGSSEISNLNFTMTNNSSKISSFSDNIQTNFSIQPKISFSSSSSLINSSILFGTDTVINQNLYLIPNHLYSSQSKCGTLSPITNFMIENYQTCPYISPNQIIKNQLYLNSYKNQINETNASVSILSLETNSIPISLAINSDIVDRDLTVKRLAQYKTDLNEVVVTISTQKIGLTFQVYVQIENNGSQIAFLLIQCTQGTQQIYNQFMVFQPDSSTPFSISFSKSAPYNDLIFNITNILNSQYYSFRKPASLIQDTSQIQYQLQSKIGVPKTSITQKFMIEIVVGCGSIIVIGIFLCVVYRRRKNMKKQKQMQLNILQLKSSPSQKQLIQKQFIINQIKPLQIITQKPPTSTTIDSSKHHHSDSLNPQLQNVPSLEDKLEFKQPIDDLQIQMNVFKSKSKKKRVTRTLPNIPSQLSEERFNQKLEQDVESLDNQSL